ncbi:hypothetical protein HJA87_20390 [Rhizobium bangladeshense]|uniref:DUF3618 domain-containing protein n=1 Tax=Rhizobium bangladeshense TaxID=1138189 RepID=A0ABS7LLD5_9HYPH|nr:hypothetical protein [Rhizobium bangladeshense]MBX4871896.1 hypothetical protein [Rhizobium bangladeshense]MBX4883210.1 hypothetical protein [Rhizobium bangladeshense]MBX4923303.1 hypothetical protein [Rhizobium bangladeshense]MBY3592215.1 hypothetical protein [Rhizobium bangladeshense]QSY97023.1 hypothetical protein J2J97_23440 [Rhizobium bangladeshense]
MPRRKSTETMTLDTEGAKIGEPVPKAIIDVNTASVGVPRQAEHDLRTELSALRKQIDTLQQQVMNAGQSAKGGAGKAIRQTEALVKHHPLSTFVFMAVAAGLFVVASHQLSPSRRRRPSAVRDLGDFYDRLRAGLTRF